MKPSIQFAKRNDGIQIAYSKFGNGPIIVAPPPWATSLQFIIEDPSMNHFMERLSQNLTVVFYDKHGCGQSDRDRKVFTLESELFDLETVVEHLGLSRFNLLGTSMAGPVSIEFIARYPDKVNKLVLYGSYADGEKVAQKKVQRAIISLIEASWGLGSKTLADLFTPDATAEELKSHARYQQLSTSPETAIRILELCYSVDVTKTLPSIKIPTLILHREGDKAIPIYHGRELSKEISNSTFKIINGNSHPMWHGDSNKIADEIVAFVNEEKLYNISDISTEQKVTRKLTAILSADVKDYSILMVDDEISTVQTLKVYRNLMSVHITQKGGRVVDAVGDNLLAEFSSAVDAVRCAVEIQRELKDKNNEIAEDKRLKFRIGINVGDVIQDGDRLFGDGVNVAARIEGLADAGGVCISRNVYDHVKNKVELSFEYLGEHEVKNIMEPVRVYRVLMDTKSHNPLVEEELELPYKPSIAVLPFTNMSGDPSQEYFSDGLTEQIINGLCKVSNLFVIARNSSFAYKGKVVSVKQIAKELGVRYILEGSVQRAVNRVRITAQLIDAATDYHMWSENYDRDLEDIFALQDEITMNLISAMHVKLTSGEQARLWAGGTTNIHAYDKWARTMECIFQRSEQSIAQARKFAEEAIELDPMYAFAYVALAYTHFIDLIWGFSKSPLLSFDQIEKLSEKALELNDSLDYAHMLLGMIFLFKRQYDEAIKKGEKAVSLNPNGADVLALLGLTLNFAGEPKRAIPILEKAIRLNPIPPSHYFNHLSISYRLIGHFNRSIKMCNKAISIEPNDVTPYVALVATYVYSGQEKMAREVAAKIIKINPNFSPVEFGNKMPYKDKAELGRFVDSLTLTDQNETDSYSLTIFLG